MLNGYIDMLVAVEKQSIRCGQEGDVSLFAIEDVPSFNRFAIFRLAAPLLANLSLKNQQYPFFHVLLCVTDCWMFVKAPRPSLGNLSKALLKAREAQTILVKPDLVSEDTWENDSRRGMDVLNERCEGDISPGIISIDIDSVVFKICSRLAPVQTGMKTI